MNAWKVGDKIAVHQTEKGWVVMDAEGARKIGVTDDNPGWYFAEVAS